jgi:hypothetical protein
LSCTEISDDPVLVARLKKLYDILDVGTTPTTVLVPWLPTPAMIKKIWATKGIYEIVIKAIKDRENSGISQGDTLQMLLDTGDETRWGKFFFFFLSLKSLGLFPSALD